MVAAVILSVLAIAPPASAHAVLVGSDPSDGETLEVAPRTVNLLFDEPVDPVTTAFGLYDSEGRYSPGGVPSRIGVSAVDTAVAADLPADLPDGSYLLAWRVVSGDAHPISGVLSFVVGEPSAREPVAPRSDDGGLGGAVGPTVLVLQVLTYLGLMSAAGLGAFRVLVLRGAPPVGSRRRLLRIGAAVGGLAGVLLAAATVVRETGGPISDLLEAGTWTAAASAAPGLAAALGLAGAAVLVLGDRAGRTAAVLTIVGLGLVAASVVPTGHTRTYGPGPLMAVLDVVHVVTGAIWLGGLAGLLAHLRRSRTQGDDPVAVAGDVVRFSNLAGLLVVILGISGLGMAVVVLGTPSALLSTGYGRALLVKTSVVALVAVLAVWNKVWLVDLVSRRPAAGAQWAKLRGAVRDEAVLLVVVLALTGLLTLQSPNSPAAAPLGVDDDTAAVTSDTSPRRADLGDGSLQAQLQPARVGSNRLVFTVRDGNGEPAGAAELPQVTATLPSEGLGPLRAEVTLIEGTSRFEATLDLPVGGTWRVLVAVTPLADPAAPDGTPQAQQVAVLELPVGD